MRTMNESLLDRLDDKTADLAHTPKGLERLHEHSARQLRWRPSTAKPRGHSTRNEGGDYEQ